MRIMPYTKNNKTYYKFQAYLGTDSATGKRVRITKSGFTSEKKCREKYNELQDKFDNDEYTIDSKLTFQYVYDNWVKVYSNSVKESTLQKTTKIFENHILPIFGNMYISKIKVNHCQDAVEKWYEVRKDFKVVNNYTSLVFQFGMKSGSVKTDPTKLITMPTRRDEIEDDKPENFFSTEELIAFLEHVETNKDPKWFALFRLLAYTGCRKGEALALTWEDINFHSSTATVRITKTLTRGLQNKLIIQSPKTKKSKRTITIDAETVNILKLWKTQQANIMLMLDHPVNKKKQLVFSNSMNTYLNPQKLGQKIEAFCNQIELKVITTHGFRHTHCSILFESGGVSPVEVQKRLGHADIRTTMNIYAHVTKERAVNAMQCFTKYVDDRRKLDVKTQNKEEPKPCHH